MASEAHLPVRGDWHAAGSSHSAPAELHTGNAMLGVVNAGGALLTQAGFADIEISDRVGAIPRRLIFPDGSVFETRNNDGVDRIVAMHRGARSGWIHRAEAFRPRLIAFVLGVVILLAVLYRYALPGLVEIAVAVTPPVVPQAMSKGTLQSMDRLILQPSSMEEDKQAFIRSGFDALVAAADRDDIDFELHFRGGGYLGPNAFALPDGTLVVTDELIELAGEDLEMVVGVLGHEIGHVTREHSLRQLYRALGVAGMIMLIGGDVGEGVEDLLVQGGGLLSLSFSRKSEAEADAESVELMAKAGRDPTAIGRFFELLERELGDRGETSWFGTHPGTPERREAIDAMVKSLAPASK